MRKLEKEGLISQHRCPKCGGNTYTDRDHYGWYQNCLQCGCIRDLPRIMKGEVEGRISHG
ncbi:hypothetical protein ACFLU4_00610 [Chloroflexota bacterium]